MAFAPFVIFLWERAKSRLSAFCVFFSYYGAASHGIINGAPVFFGPAVPHHYGLFLWLASAFALSLPWALLWSERFNPLFFPLRLIAGLASSIIPPLAVVGWTNPILAVAVFFPAGWGYWALLAFVAGISFMVYLTRLKRQNLYLFIAFCLIIQFMPLKSPSPAAGWTGIDTSFGKLASGSSPSVEDWQRYNALRPLLDTIIDKTDSKIIILPETIAGRWTRLNAATWLLSIEEIARSGKIIAVGAELWEASKYDNAMLFFFPDGSTLKAIQRLPVPISMYRPWDETGANAYWFADGVISIHDNAVLVLICYEQFLIWPFLWSVCRNDIDIVIGTANDWWCKDTNLPRIQNQTISLLCRLFSLDLVTATNL